MLIAVFIVCVILSAYFSCTESAFSSMNKIRVKSMAEAGNKRAKNALYISNNFEKALTTLLIGNNIVNIAAASVATVYAVDNWGMDVATLYSTLITTAVIFFFGEMIPKTLASDRSETMALLFAGSLKAMMKICHPIALLLGYITNFFTKLFVKDSAPSITEEELYDIIETIEEEGVMDEEQSDLFKSALDFSETTVKDVMTMRADISGVDISTPNDEILSFIRNSNHSRLLVYSGDLDNIVGILQIRVFIREYLKSRDFDVRSILSEPFFVSPDENIDALLTKMRQQKNYIAVVASEEKKTYGLVTIEDFLEELVGEIWDEDDVVDNDFVKLGGNKFSIDTRLTVKDAFSKMGVECDDSPTFSRPIISWIIETFGHFPEEEESFDYQNLSISVEEIKDRRITRITVKINSDIDEQHSAPIKEEIPNE